ncbi:DUF4352 domain-containing protein [Methanoregula sp.]|uniref:DUF4352 domain-containing protein n=1 Tax=Methanoregula sp. TaxID=2052170 RepID=UPI003C70802D
MTVKRCPKCKMDNPAIYDRCLNCGTPLPEITHPGMDRYLLPGIVVVMVVLITGVLIIPALHISMASGRDLSTAINGVSATPTPVPEYQINQPARVGDLQVTVTDTRPGENQFNGKRFYTVTLSVQNFNSNETYTLSATDFTLTDAGENYYSSLGIQSKPSYDILPGTTGVVDLVYIVPLSADKLRLLYTFPASTAAPGESQIEVAFVL